MGLRQRMLATVAGQLGRPHGPVGRVIASLLNCANRPAVVGAVYAAEATSGNTAADIGFGDGLGLDLFFERVGPQGTVYGVEIAEDMLARVRARHATRSGRDGYSFSMVR